MADEPLLLGLVGENMDENEDKICGWGINKIGGTPNWMLGAPPMYPSCSLCRKLLFLVCQIYCPLSNSIFHRVLYIFACVNPCCWNKHQSWKVLRSQTKDSTYDHTSEMKTESSDSRFEVEDWTDDANDWGDEETQQNVASIDLGLLTSKLNITENKVSHRSCDRITAGIQVDHNNKGCLEKAVPHFKPFYINVIEADPNEKEISQTLTRHEEMLLTEYQHREGVVMADLMYSVEGASRWMGEKYEQSSFRHRNKAFYRFNKKLQTCPQQCLRYQWNGVPVSMVTTTPPCLKEDVPPCPYCGTQRVFEVQFMPALVGKLKAVECMRTVFASDFLNEEQNKVPGTSWEQESPWSWDPNDMGTISGTSLEGFDVQGPLQNGTVVAGKPGIHGENRKAFMAAVTQTSDVAIEFGTVMVYTCAKSCWELSSDGNNIGTGYLCEFVIVEADPDATLFQ